MSVREKGSVYEQPRMYNQPSVYNAQSVYNQGGGGTPPPLPDTYTRLTGVRFRDRTYVRTNFRFNSTQYIEADLSYTPKTSESFNALFGARISNNYGDQYTIYGRYYSDNDIYLESGHRVSNRVMSYPNYRILIYASKYKIIVKKQSTDEVVADVSLNITWNQCQSDLCIGATTDNNWQTSWMDLFGFAVKDLATDENLLYMIPCTRDSDGVVGLYDVINNIFYSSYFSSQLIAIQ